jgi:hypothetical protein
LPGHGGEVALDGSFNEVSPRRLPNFCLFGGFLAGIFPIELAFGSAADSKAFDLGTFQVALPFRILDVTLFIPAVCHSLDNGLGLDEVLEAIFVNFVVRQEEVDAAGLGLTAAADTIFGLKLVGR